MDTSQSSSEERFRYLTAERIKNFWGYGNLNSGIWFVGMEEGCDGSMENLKNRFEETSFKDVYDIYEDFRSDPSHSKWFEPNAPTQATFRKLIYLLLYIKNNKEPSLEEIRQFQINKFARKDSDHASLELMPLPAKSIREQDWLYKDTGISGLRSRKEYLAMYKPQRVKALRMLIERQKPKIVIFYSRMYIPDWQEITVYSFKEVIPNKLSIAKDDDTVFAIVPHSISFGISGEGWKEIAEQIRLATLS